MVVRIAPPEALPRISDTLLASEPEYNLLLGLLGRLVREGVPDDHLFVTIEENGEILGCGFRTPPWKAGLTRMPAEAIPDLVDIFAAKYDSLPAVMGPPDVTETFAERWCALKGVTARDGMRQRIHQATAVASPPDPPPGGLRLPSRDEFGLVADWFEAFTADAGVEFHGDVVREKLADGELRLWDHDGPRTMVGVSAWTPTGARVGPVYTPPAWRGRGYGSAATAALSQELLDGGCRFCCLYTDLANPTSNRIYAAIGYEPVCDQVEKVFN